MRRFCIYVFAGLFGFRVEKKYKHVDKKGNWLFTWSEEAQEGYCYTGEDYILLGGME